MTSNDKCKCHKCGKSYPAALFFTCPFCYVAEANAASNALTLALADIAREVAEYHATRTNCPDCLFTRNCNMNHAGDCARG